MTRDDAIKRAWEAVSVTDDAWSQRDIETVADIMLAVRREALGEATARAEQHMFDLRAMRDQAEGEEP